MVLKNNNFNKKVLKADKQRLFNSDPGGSKERSHQFDINRSPYGLLVSEGKIHYYEEEKKEEIF
jgi:hypothetical protein